MKEIYCERGRYAYDEETGRIYKDGYVVPTSQAEPVFSGQTEESAPTFSGIHLKGTDEIISMSGKISKVTDPNTL
jgi:hypothetical protein